MKAKRLEEIAAMMQVPYEGNIMVQGVAVDSRLLNGSELFFALPGAKVDGHRFLEEVAKKGITAAVVHSSYAGDAFGLTLLRADDVLEALQKLTIAFLKQSRAKIIAVTGSLGKTTTKEFIAALLKTKYSVFVSPGNHNSQIGLPLAILNHATLEEDMLVLEMGMTLKGQLSRLVQIANPFVAVVTSVALVHAVNFDSLEDIARTKGEVFTHANTQLGIYHFESNINEALSESGNCSKLTFSTTTSDADFFLDLRDDEMVVKDPMGVKTNLPMLSLPGDHNRQNFLGAVAVAKQFDVSWEDIREVMVTLTLPDRRLQTVEKNGAIFINDAYNAAELSTKAALSALPEPKPSGKRIVVFGGMTELGKFSKQCHREVAEFALKHVDLMLCFGDECLEIAECWKAAQRPVVWAKERHEIVDALRQHLRPGDVVLLKGMRTRGVDKVLEEL